MIMNRKTNKIFQACIFTGHFFSTVLGVRHFTNAVTEKEEDEEEEEYCLKGFVNYNIRSTDNVRINITLRRVHVTIVAVEEQ